ncbi:MAG TPA: hypothetical protein VEK12_11085 [Alphaproteobacteria bacterium]|nr:hypothetical protein [Alphaproteobacteria bacterium]
MQLGRFASAACLAVLLAGCGVTAVETSGGEGTITLRGDYSSVSHSAQALEKDMTAEANRRCPDGWAKIGDTANPGAISGGRIWQIRCNASVATTGGGSAAPPAPTTGAVAKAAPVQAPAPPSAAPAHATGSQLMSREDLSRVLAGAVRRAGPYLSDEAARTIVEQELTDLAAAGIRVLGPSGQVIPLARVSP